MSLQDAMLTSDAATVARGLRQAPDCRDRARSIRAGCSVLADRRNDIAARHLLEGVTPDSPTRKWGGPGQPGRPRATPSGAALAATERGDVRFMLYSHDGYGLGHFRRNLVLAQALTEARPGASVLLACAADGLDTFPLPPGVDVLRLPGLRKVGDDEYVSRRLNIGRLELHGLRASLLESAVEHFRPDVLLADKHPLGVGGELLPALLRHRRRGGRAALGLRDVLDDPERAASEWRASGLAGRVARLYERVLVYGSPDLLSPLTRGLLPAPAIARVRFCGYVVGSVPGDQAVEDLPGVDDRRLVLATAGGGEDGLSILAAFIDASRGRTWRGVVVAGPQMQASHRARLRTAAVEADVIVLDTVLHVQRWYARADAIVCMGGYNTLVEAVSSGTPTICVPRTGPRQEQLIRARTFAAKGLIGLVEPEALSGESLGSAIDSALATRRRVPAADAREVLDIGGASRAAAHLIELADDAR